MLLGSLIFGAFYFFEKQKVSSINSFEECSKLFPVMESYPEQCNTPDGRHFVQELSEEEKEKLVPPEEVEEATSTGQISLDETANWRIYSSNKWNIEFKYPPSWKLSENEGEYELIRLEKGTNMISIYPETNPDAGIPSVKVENKEKIMINGVALEINHYIGLVDPQPAGFIDLANSNLPQNLKMINFYMASKLNLDEIKRILMTIKNL